MPNMTLAIPEELKKKMDEYPEFNWSEIARQAFIRNISDLESIRDFKKDMDFTEEDAIKFGREVKKRMAIRAGLYEKYGDRFKHRVRDSSHKGND